MRSGLSALNFRKRLKKHVRLGSVFSNISPFALFYFMKEYDKTFLGEFSKKEFSLTKNAIFIPAWYRIEGTYTEINENECAVEYVIKTIRWLKILNVISYIIGGAFMSFFSFVLIAFVKGGLIPGIIVAVLICLTIIFPIYIQKYYKRSIEESFKDIFKIVDE